VRSWQRHALAALLGIYAVLGTLLVGGWVPAWFYPVAMPVMTALGMAFALLHAAGQLGWRRALFFWGVVFVVGLLMESVGVLTGWPYGPYHYTSKLGPRFLGLVPYVIPLAWFMMMYPSWVIARRTLAAGGVRRAPWAVAALTGWVMTSWDFLMDPMMVHFHHWIWEVHGAYFSVPLQNFLGWWLTVFLAILVFEASARPPTLRENTTAPLRWAVVWYGLVFLSNFSASLDAHLTGSALAGALAMLPWVLVGWVATGESAPRRRSA